MAREDALLRLHKSLVDRRDHLRRKLTDELENLRSAGPADGDAADAAFDAGSDEMSSQLAEFDARELEQIERALTRLKHGSFGLCEGCNKKIPVGRLNALPYTAMCIECQRDMERYPGWGGGRANSSWEHVEDHSRVYEDTGRVNLADLEVDLSK